MSPRRWLLMIAIIGLLAFLEWHGPTSLAAHDPAPTPFVGAGSCAAAACHNSHSPQAKTGSEYATWITQDRHARAYEVLFDERSVRIQKSLGQHIPAHQDYRCLKCHVAPELEPAVEKKAPHFRTDGVSCESCHGAADKWLNVHHLPTWQTLKPADKKTLGMNDTQSIAGRTQVCVTCHVGAPGMEVDHDLIAAGHPRLIFEFTAFHAFMPRHWADAKDRDPAKSVRGRTDFESRTWVVGQLVTTHAALELLADRARAGKKPWPEFAQHDCIACHHDLRSPSTHPPRDGKPGAVPWSVWNLGMSRQALQAIKADQTPLANLRRELNRGWNNRLAIADSAKFTAQQLKSHIDHVDRLDIDFSAALRSILLEDNPKEEDAGQIALALAALCQSQIEHKASASAAHRLAIQRYSRKLEFHKSGPRSTGIDADPIRARLLEFKNLGAK